MAKIQLLKICNLRVQKLNLNIEKITFKTVQIKLLAVQITVQKLRFDVLGRKFTEYLHGKLSLLNILIWHKIKIDHFDPNSVFLAIAYLRLVLWSRLTYLNQYTTTSNSCSEITDKYNIA